MKNLIDFRKMVEIGVDRRSASARDYPMEMFKGAVKKTHILGVRKFFIFTVGKNVPEYLYCRRKVKCSSFSLKNGSVHFGMTHLKG